MTSEDEETPEERIERVSHRLEKASQDLQALVDELRRAFGHDPDDYDDGLAGVREPRRPYPTQVSGAGAREIGES